MLDMYLEILSTKTAQEVADRKQTELLKNLPNELLYKIATGEEKLACIDCTDGGSDTWIKQFKGTPLFEQALELEQQGLQLEMSLEERRRQNRQEYDQEDQMRQEIRIRRRMLMLELAKLQAGGDEDEDEEEDLSEEMASPPAAIQAPPSAAPAEKAAGLADVAVPAAVLGGAGYMGYGRGKREALEGEPAPEWSAGKYLASGLFPPYGAYQVGKTVGYDKTKTDKLERKQREKEASIAPEKIAAMRFAVAATKMQKEAVGAAMLQGLRGAGKFVGEAAKGLKGAYQAGGMKQVGQALKTQGQLGVAGAKNFVQQNPLAGAGLAAGAAGTAGLGAGYMAGKG